MDRRRSPGVYSGNWKKNTQRCLTGISTQDASIIRIPSEKFEEKKSHSQYVLKKSKKIIFHQIPKEEKIGRKNWKKKLEEKIGGKNGGKNWRKKLEEKIGGKNWRNIWKRIKIWPSKWSVTGISTQDASIIRILGEKLGEKKILTRNMLSANRHTEGW